MSETRKDALKLEFHGNKVTTEAGMICETAENRVEGMEANGGGLPKWWEKAGFGCTSSTFWRFFRHSAMNPLELSCN